ncbi:MAG: hypothetical protein NT018_07480, partial [Armatimonadetes bacterium]|nr:hypothetical protein [Armatimonadota bacterium]
MLRLSKHEIKGCPLPKRGILMPKQRGAAYILAIVTLLVGMTLALVTLQMGNAYFLAANSRT